MYIEDFIIYLSRLQLSSVWDEKLIYSFCDQLYNNNYLTEKQRHLALVIVRKYKKDLQPTYTQIENFLKNPVFKYPVRTINNSVCASIATYDKWGSCVKVEFPYNQDFVEEIRKSRSFFDLATFDKDQKAWFFSLNENALSKIIDIFKNLTCDEHITKYLNDIRHIKNNMDNFVPMLTINQGIPTLKNISDHIPPLVSTEIIPAIFESLKKGVTVWDNEIDSYIHSDAVDNITRHFLKKDPNSTFNILGEKHSVNELDIIIKNLLPCLVVVPINYELEILQLFCDYINEQNYSKDDVSVMFRLNSSTEKNKNFNTFVKEQNLNNPITENTKFIVVSSQIPKPVYKKNVKFNSILNFGYVNAHYTVRSAIKNCQNVITFDYTNKLKQMS